MAYRMLIVKSFPLQNIFSVYSITEDNLPFLIGCSISGKCDIVSTFFHRYARGVCDRSIFVICQCPCSIRQRYGFAHLQSHCLAGNAGRGVKLIYFFEHSLFEALILGLRGNAPQTADVARDRDRRRADKVPTEVGDGFPDEKLCVKLSDVLAGHGCCLPIVIHRVGRTLYIGDIFVSAPVVDEGESVKLFICQLSLSVTVIIA